MPQYYQYRITMVHVEPSSAKTRKKQIDVISSFETTNNQDANREINRLLEMKNSRGWKLSCEVVCERAEVSDYQRCDLTTLEPINLRTNSPGFDADDQAESGNES